MPDIKTSPHCELVLSKPPECTDFRKVRSWVLCKAWGIMDERKLTKLPIKEAWVEAHKTCPSKRASI
jgi:hypothetical protein